jgi:hypothetical protein
MDCGANAAAPPFPGGPTACRNAPTVRATSPLAGGLARAWPGCLSRVASAGLPWMRWSGVTRKTVTGQFARIVGKRLVDGFFAIRQAFFDVFDDVA